MGPFLVRWGGLSRLEAAGVYGLLVLYVGIYVAAFAWAVHRVAARWGPDRALLLAPAIWTAVELARSHLLTGFPWCLLGYSQWRVPPALQVADLAGVHAVSFVLACASSLAACFAGGAGGGRSRRRGRPAAVAALVAIVAGALLYGVWSLRAAGPPGEAGGVPVALVQSGVPQEEKWDPDERRRIEDRHAEMTRRAAEGGAALVVWSESSVPVSLTADAVYRGRVEALARETGVELIVGSVAYETREGRRAPRNSAFLVTPGGGIAGRYDKRRLVPFGEYVPLRSLLFFLEPLVHEAGDFEPGRAAEPLASGAGALGTLICYESIFPDLAVDLVRAGAGVLVNVTNDSWYGDTGMPAQHLSHAVVRAVETRRWLLRCASTGISAIVEPTGRIAARADGRGAATLTGSFRPLVRLTIYARLGDAFAWGCAILALLSLLVSARAPSPGGADAV